MSYPVVNQPGQDKMAAENPQYNQQNMAMAPVTTQPGQHGGHFGGANQPATPGLEYLSTLNRVDVHQVLHLIEVLTGWEKNNQYQICNDQNQEFLHAKEDTDCMNRQCFGNIRPLNIMLSGMQGEPIMQVERPLRCGGCLCPCCLQYLDINYPPGNNVARIKEVWTCMVPKYEVEDTAGNVLFRIEGDCCYCKCCTDVNFRVTRADGSEAGAIIKHWGGCREMMGQVNDFSVEYAPGETTINKAILLGATFLVDFMYFEINKNN